MPFEQSSKDTLATFLPANDELQELWKADNVVEKALLPNLQYLEARAEFQLSTRKALRTRFNFLIITFPYLSELNCAGEQYSNEWPCRTFPDYVERMPDFKHDQSIQL